MSKYKCTECDSDKIAKKMWLDMNTGEIFSIPSNEYLATNTGDVICYKCNAEYKNIVEVCLPHYNNKRRMEG